MVADIRAVEQALGLCGKSPQPVELQNREVVRKSLVAAQAIMEGECFSAGNLASKRPGDGLSPMEYWRLLGKASPRAYRRDEKIE